MGKAGTLPDKRLAATAQLALADDDLALFVLNVGDGDALVLRLPFEGTPSGPSRTKRSGETLSTAASGSSRYAPKGAGLRRRSRR